MQKTELEKLQSAVSLAIGGCGSVKPEVAAKVALEEIGKQGWMLFKPEAK